MSPSKGKRLADLWCHLRQLRYPAAFRIPPPHPLADEAPPPVLEAGAPPFSPSTPPQVSGPNPPSVRSLLPLCLHLWRTERRMLDPTTNTPLPEYSRLYRHIQSAMESLEEAGFSIQDHTGQPYHEGELLKVIAAEPSSQTLRPTVLQTLKPSIYFQTHQVQLGEVILSVPVEREQTHRQRFGEGTA